MSEEIVATIAFTVTDDIHIAYTMDPPRQPYDPVLGWYRSAEAKAAAEAEQAEEAAEQAVWQAENQDVMAFLADLAALSKRHGLYVYAPGHMSLEISGMDDQERETGRYHVEGDGDQANFEWRDGEDRS